MIEWFRSLDPVLQALLAGCLTWSVTALGAALVFVTRDISQRFLDAMLGFAAGIMIAASFWSLLVPSIEMAAAAGGTAWLPALSGFLTGGAVLRLVDEYLPHLHIGLPRDLADGTSTAWRRTTLLVLAITLHRKQKTLRKAFRVSRGPRCDSIRLLSVAFGGREPHPW